MISILMSCAALFVCLCIGVFDMSNITKWFKKRKADRQKHQKELENIIKRARDRE